MMEYIDKHEFGAKQHQTPFKDLHDDWHSTAISQRSDAFVESASDKLIAKREELGMLEPCRNPCQHVDVKLDGGELVHATIRRPI